MVVELYVQREGFDNFISFSIIFGSKECEDILSEEISSFIENLLSILFFKLYYFMHID